MNYKICYLFIKKKKNMNELIQENKNMILLKNNLESFPHIYSYFNNLYLKKEKET